MRVLGCKSVALMCMCGLTFLPGHLMAGASDAGTVQSGTISIDATAFEVDGKQNVVIASGNVVVKQGDVTLFGNAGIYYQTVQKVILSGNVKVVRDAMTLTCDRAVAHGKEDRIEVTGNVVFVRGDIRGTSGVGVYDRKSQTIQLSGDPKVWQNRDELTGKTILVDIRRSKVTTQGGAKAVFSVDKFSGR